MINSDSVTGAGADAGAAAVTLFCVDLRGADLTTSWTELNGVRLTAVFTTAALHASVGQAFCSDFNVLLPGLFSFRPKQGLVTNRSALVAKSAFAAAEIDGRKTAVTPDDDLSLTMFNAGVTAVTIGKEALFIFGPWEILALRFSGLISGHFTSEECPTAQIDHLISSQEGLSESEKSRQ